MVKLRKKKLNDNSFSLYLDIYNNGQRKYEFLQLHLKNDKIQNKEILRLAESIRAKREIELRNAHYGFTPEHNSKIDFIDYMTKVGNTKNTSNRKRFESCLNYVRKFAKGGIRVSAINEIWLGDFEDYLKENLSNTSVVDYMLTLRVALNTAIRERIILVSPFIYYKQKTKVDQAKKEFLTFDEILMLNNTKCNKEQIKHAFLFACYTGLRISDVRNLKWDNVKDDHLELKQQKTKQLLYLPLSETAKNILLHLRGNIYELENKPIFELPCLATVLKYLDKWVQSAGIKKHITTHCGRHTFATLSLTQGVDLYTVSKLLGHSSVSVTQVYAKIVDQKKIEAVNKLPNMKLA